MEAGGEQEIGFQSRESRNISRTAGRRGVSTFKNSMGGPNQQGKSGNSIVGSQENSPFSTYTRSKLAQASNPQPKINEEDQIFDWIKFESMNGKFMMNDSNDNFLVKISDSTDKPIIYDKALEDFNRLNIYLKKLICFFIENNLIDFCFDAIQMEDVNLKDERGLNQNHLKMKVSESPKTLNIEYLVYKVYKVEAEYQAAKVRIIDLMYDVMKHLNSPEVVNKFIKAINRLI